MSTPLPEETSANLAAPDRREVEFICRGLRSAARPTDQDDEFQRIVLEAVARSMTGFAVDFAELQPIGAARYAAGLAGRSEMFRTRLVQVMELGHLVLRHPDVDVADRVIEFADEMSVDSACIHQARAVADGSHQLVAADFDRNAYIVGLSGSSGRWADASVAWSQTAIDDDLAARWRGLGDLPAASIGRKVHQFYEARGFRFPGEPGSAPPLLAQHDWVHVLGDFGTTVECELEVFGFIARASHDPQAFALLAMAVLLFQTGSLASAAGIFQADAGHLCATGMPMRLADAMRRGAQCRDGVDFLSVDWFAVADRPVEELREHFCVADKDDDVRAAGSVGPWEPGGISPFQLAAGQRLAADQDRSYESHGATTH